MVLFARDRPREQLAFGIAVNSVGAKVLNDLDRLGNRETPAILNLLVIEDLAMAAYLPTVAALVTGRPIGPTVATVAVALAAVALILTVALRWGNRLSSLLAPGSDEAVLLAVFGLTLLVAGLAQQVEVSAAIGAFVVGLALSGPVQARAGALIGPLRDLFAATFFLFFSFQIRPPSLIGALAPGGGARRRRHRGQDRIRLGRVPTTRHRTARAAQGGDRAHRPGRVLHRHRQPRRGCQSR